jgi:site-specific DNA recombinase
MRQPARDQPPGVGADDLGWSQDASHGSGVVQGILRRVHQGGEPARQDQAAQRSGLEAELARIERRIRKMVDAIADGVPARSLRDELLGLEARQDQITGELTASPEPKVYLAPSMSEIYRQKVRELHQVLAAGSEQPEVYEALRSLIDRVVLTPIDGALTIDLHGEIAEILKLSAGGKKHGAEAGEAAKQLVMVAGVGFEPTTFRL